MTEYGDGPHRRAGSISEVDDKVEGLSDEVGALVKRLVWLEDNRHALCPSNLAAGDVAETARREAKDARVKAARACKDVGEALDILDRNHIRLRTILHVTAALFVMLLFGTCSAVYWIQGVQHDLAEQRSHIREVSDRLRCDPRNARGQEQ